jgi:putative RecB family exonuclease
MAMPPISTPVTGNSFAAEPDSTLVSNTVFRKPALSPSRASDFKQCPLLYRLRAIDRLSETPSPAQVRGTVVHAVLEDLLGLPAHDRTPEQAHALLAPVWKRVQQERPEFAELFVHEQAAEEKWLSSAAELLDSYFLLENPQTFNPDSRELLVEWELPSGVLLRGYIDRIDVAPTGEIRVVDYKTGIAPREIGEAKALFQMKFYALVLWKLRDVVPHQLRLLYLGDKQVLTYRPNADELGRFERTLEAIWQAITQLGTTGNFQPTPSRLCQFCDYKALCPAFGGTPPLYPGWPSEPMAADLNIVDLAD